VKFKFIISLLISSFLIYSYSFSQGKISGIIRDSKDLSPVRDAVVKVVMVSDSTLKSGTNSDSSGFFSISNLRYGIYKLNINAIGYSAYNKVNISINENTSSIFLDTIKLKPDTYRTEEITVESEKPLMELVDDKKVFNVEKILSAKGGTAIEVLKKLPMIDVDASDNVSLRGSANAIILIDNKPMKFASLRQIPADAIQTVEIITNPSAKYEAEGVTGIINIVMKKSNPDMVGYNGFVYGSLSDKTRYYLSGGVNLKLNKWSIFINLGAGFYKYSSTSTNSVNYLNPVSFYESSSYGEGNNKYGFPSLGVEYEIVKNHTIGFDTYSNFSGNDNNFFVKNSNFNNVHNLSSYYTNDNIANGNFKNYSGSLYYNGKFNSKGEELNAEFTYSGSNSDFVRDNSTLYYDSLFSLINPNYSKLRNTTIGKTDNFRIQADYTNPLTDNTKIETGYKGIFRINDNDFRSDSLHNDINVYITNTDLTNHFKLSDYINAGYVILTQKIKNFRFKLGLRLEHTYTKGELITNNSSFTKNYLNLFPTLNLSQKFGASNEISIGYSRRITRPMIYRMNPFVNRYNNKFINFGNPELTPEFTDSFELTYSFISNIATLTPMLFYRRSYDVISNYSYIIDTNVTVNTYKNFAGGKAYGMDFIINSNALKWWSLNSTLSFYKSIFEGDITNDYTSEEGFSWQARIRSTFTVSNFFNIEFYYNYTGKKITTNGSNDPSQSLDIAINKKFFKNKVNLSVRADDVFSTSKWGGQTKGTGLSSVNSYKWDSRSITLNFSYNFGNTDDYYRKSKKTKQNENESQDQSNDNGK
jgi:outer membrane receptor protein involved in Fe transport